MADPEAREALLAAWTKRIAEQQERDEQMSRRDPEHQHNEMIGTWCECGDGPFTPATWDDHRMGVLGHLPLTLVEEMLLDELDANPSAERRHQIESILARSAQESLPPLTTFP